MQFEKLFAGNSSYAKLPYKYEIFNFQLISLISRRSRIPSDLIFFFYVSFKGSSIFL